MAKNVVWHDDGGPRTCDHAARVPAVQVLRVHGDAAVSVLQRSGGYSSCMLSWCPQCKLCSKPPRFHRYTSWVGGRRTRCSATTGLYMLCVSLRLLAEFHAFLHEGELSDPEVDLVFFSSPQRRTTEKYAQLMLQILFCRVSAHLADMCSLCEFCGR